MVVQPARETYCSCKQQWFSWLGNLHPSGFWGIPVPEMSLKVLWCFLWKHSGSKAFSIFATRGHPPFRLLHIYIYIYMWCIECYCLILCLCVCLSLMQHSFCKSSGSIFKPKKDGAAVVASKLRGGHLPLVHVPGRNHGVARGRDEFDPPNEWLIDIIVVNGVW